MTTETETPLQTAGAVDIQELTLVSKNMEFLQIKDYLAELNITEDLYSPTMYGNLVLVDNRNLIKELDITGEEYLIVKFKTPTSESFISKTFRIYAITDRKIVRDLNTQTYVLQFVSKEFIINQVKPIYKTFSGKISEVVKTLFEYIEADRTYIVNDKQIDNEGIKSELNVVTETENVVKFVSPGWTPFKCITWCASKSIPKDGKACNFFFFETNKTFVFTSIENLFDINNKGQSLTIGEYFYKQNQVKGNEGPENKMFQVEDFKVLKTADHLENLNSGYLSNKLITLDVINKIYSSFDYDAVTEFETFEHSQGSDSSPLFAKDSIRNPSTDISFYPVQPNLFNNVDNNINERMNEIHGNRRSNMLELQNFKIHMTVPGRTDLEVGRMLDFNFPDVSPKAQEDKSDKGDAFYSGTYLITAIHHKVTLNRHTMIMEIVKDALKRDE